MGSLSDSVMNWGQLFAMKQRMDANARAQAEADATKRYLAEQVGMLQPGAQVDLSTLPDSSILDRQYQYKQQTDWAAQQREVQRQNMQAAVNELQQTGRLRHVLDDKFFQKAADLGVVIPEDGIPDRFKSPDKAMLDSITGEFSDPVPAYLRDPRMYGSQEDALKAIAEYGKTAVKKKPEYTVDQLQAIPGFASMSPEHQAAAVAAVQSTGKAPTQEFWMQAMVPKPEKVKDHLTPEEIDRLEQIKKLNPQEAETLRATGGDWQLARSFIQSTWDNRLPNAAKSKRFELDIDQAKEDLARVVELRKVALSDSEKTARDEEMATAMAALQKERSDYKAFLEEQAKPQDMTQWSDDQIDAEVNKLIDKGASDEEIKRLLMKKVGK